jgi:hypothetical protein
MHKVRERERAREIENEREKESKTERAIDRESITNKRRLLLQ